MSTFGSSARYSDSKLFSTKSTLNAVTPGLWKFGFIALFCLVPMILCWLFAGEFNIIGNNWFVPIGGRYFVDSAEANLLNASGTSFPGWNKNPGFYGWSLSDEFLKNPAMVDQLRTIIPGWGQYYLLKPWVFVIACSILVFDIIFLLILNYFTKIFHLDAFPFLLSSWTALFCMICSGLIPSNASYKIPVVIVVLIFSFMFSFVSFNVIFNQIIVNSKNADLYYFDLLAEMKESKEFEEETKKQGMKKYHSDDEEFVELEE